MSNFEVKAPSVAHFAAYRVFYERTDPAHCGTRERRDEIAKILQANIDEAKLAGASQLEIAKWVYDTIVGGIDERLDAIDAPKPRQAEKPDDEEAEK